jgi:aspartate/methionine/tyrosine aminotransferase
VASYLGLRGTPVDADRVVLTAGTSEAYAHLFRMLADPGECVLVPTPGYPMFGPIAALEGLGVETYRLAWDGAWHLDLADLERALRRDPRAVVVVQPNVPAGSCLDARERDLLAARCAERGIALISDEVFGDFPWAPGRETVPGFLGETRALTFVLGGLSKACGLPQLKLSWICVSGPDPACGEAIDALEWISDLFLSVGTPVQLALPALLRGRPAFRERAARRLERNLAAIAGLERRVPAVTRLGGEGGWSAVLRLPSIRTGEAWAIALLERGVRVHPGEFYDLDGGSHVVVSLLPPPDEFDRALDRLAAEVGEG